MAVKASELFRDEGEPVEISSALAEQMRGVNFSRPLCPAPPRAALEIEGSLLTLFARYAEQEAQMRENLRRMIVESPGSYRDPLFIIPRRPYAGTEE